MKKTLLIIALTLFCTVLAFTQSANDLLSQGIAAEKKGDNIQALTLYIQAYTADRKLADAESRMWDSLETVRFGNFNSNFNKETQSKNPAELMKLHNDWDKLFEAVVKFIDSNPPKFGLAYNDNPEICDIDYTDGTASVSVAPPFLYEFYEVALPNQKIVDILKFTLEHIEKHENWGWKINNFPSSYFDFHNDAKNSLTQRIHAYELAMGKSKLEENYQKLIEKALEKYEFTVSLYSDNKNISTKKFSRTVLYSSRFANFSVNVDETDKDSIIFDNIPIDSINSESLHINIEKSPIPICLTDVLDEKYQLEKYRLDDFRGERWDSEYYFFCNKSALQAIDKIKNGTTGNTETVKIIGYCGDVFPLSIDTRVIFNINYLKRICEDIGFSL
ncbi:MAG: hypothetical protein IKO39_05135, partial [Treponema sp.]|nr:hypothetical protein [Treponema sp.]